MTASYCLLDILTYSYLLCKVRKTAKVRKRYNQVLHLTQDITWESNKNTINITNKSQEVSPFPAGDRNAAMNRRESMRNTRHKNTNDPQKKYRLGTVSKPLWPVVSSLVVIPWHIHLHATATGPPSYQISEAFR